MGTIIEAARLKVILDAVVHARQALVEQGASRISSMLRVDQRLDKPRVMEDKVLKVLNLLDRKRK